MRVLRLEPEALWAIGSLVSFFAILIAGSNSAKRAFLGEPWAVGAVAVWSGVGLLISLAIIFFFATIDGSRANKFRFPSLFVVLFGGFYALLSFSGVTSIAALVGRLLELNVYWLSPVLTEFVAVSGAIAAFLVFRIWRKVTQQASTAQLRSVAGGLGLVGIYFMVSIHLLPPGVNSHFVADTWLLLWGLALLILSGISASAGGHLSSSVRKKSRWRASDLLFAVVPMIPIVRYSIVNVELLPGGGVFLLFGATAALALVLVIVVPRSLAALMDTSIVIPMSSAALYVFYNMASYSGSRNWFGSGNAFEQIAILVAATLALVLFSKIRKSFFAAGLIAFIVLEVSLAVVQRGEFDEGASGDSGSSAAPSWLSDLTSATWQTSPNVFFLTYESYANQETFDSYGIDNSEQMEFLLEEGFTIYDGTYSLGGHSLASLSRVLDISAEPRNGPARYVTAGNSLVTEVFRSRGYETHGVFTGDYFLRGQAPGYSSVYPSPDAANVAETSFLGSIFRGEFRFEGSFVSTDYDTYLDKKREILGLNSAKPQFLWSHSSYPGHTQNSGTCLPDEVEKYSAGLEQANAEMTFDLSKISDVDQSIVIIAGDHGPYLTKNCAHLGSYPASEIERLDIQDRYGTFLAIRWPEGVNSAVEIEVLQNVFPAVFEGLSESDGIFEPAKVVAATKEFLAGAVYVNEGIISGGQDDGEPLFLNRDKRSLR